MWRQRAARTIAFSFAKQSSMGLRFGTVRGQIPQGGVGALDGVADAGDLVCAEVIGDYDVAGVQRRHQDLFDVG